MKKTLLATLILVAALSLLAPTAFAGAFLTNVVRVYVSSTAPYAYGTLSQARRSSDSVQYIGCSQNGTSGSCTARDSSGNNFYCSTTNYNLLDSIRSIGTDSRIYVTANSSATCTTIIVENSSLYMPL